MPMKDGFDPDHPLPRFLAEPQFLTGQAEQVTRHAPDGVAPTSRAVKASILIATVMAIGVAVLAAGDPMALFAEGSASLVDSSSPESAPPVQTAAAAPAAIPSPADAPASVLPADDAQASSQGTKDAPSRSEMAASEPAGKDQTENGASASETLFAQFQAWAAEQDAQTRGGPAQPVQDAPAQAVQKIPAPAAETVRERHRLAQKRRHVRALRNARAEMRSQALRKQARREHIRRVQSEPAARPPVQDARAQDLSLQNAQTPSWLPGFGPRN